MEEAELPSWSPVMGASEVLWRGWAAGPSGSHLSCSPCLEFPLRLLPVLPLPLDQVQPLLVPLLQLLLVGGNVLCLTGRELVFDELGGQSQKVS